MQKNTDLFLSDIEKKACIPYSHLSFVDALPQSLETMRCSLCQGFVLNPVNCKCEEKHLFGRKCLLDFLNLNNGFCPISHEGLNLKQISSASFEILEKLNRFKVKCELCQDFQGSINALKYHLKECGSAIIPCPLYGRFCFEKVMKKDLKQHIKENLEKHIEAAKSSIQIEKMQMLFEVIQEKFKYNSQKLGI